MLGRIDPTRKEALVVGAGIAGLLAAYELDRKGFEVTLIEASDRSGGLLETTEHARGLVESAAHSFLASPCVSELCAELGVELIAVQKASRARYVLRNGKLRKFPLSLGEAVGAFLRAYFKLSSPRIETMEDWGQYFLGPAATRFLIAPMISGIYGVHPRDLTVRAAFPKLVVPPGQSVFSYFVVRRFLQRLAGRGSPRVKSPMVAPEGGMQSIVRALELRLKSRLGARFRMGEKIEKITRNHANIILTVPASEAARMLASDDEKLAEALRQIQYAPLTSVTAFACRRDLECVPNGVGVLFPASEAKKSLGILFNSSAFEGRVKDPVQDLSLSLIFAGRPAAVEASVRSDLESLFGLQKQAPLAFVSHAYEQAIPLYDARLENAWALARSGWCATAGQVLFGNYSGQVSLRGMIECIRKIPHY